MKIYDPQALTHAADYLSQQSGSSYAVAADRLRRAAVVAEEQLQFVRDVGSKLKEATAVGAPDRSLGEMAVALVEQKFDLQVKPETVPADGKAPA